MAKYLAIDCIIDAHAHLPVSSFPHRYLERLVEAGVAGVAIIGLPDMKRQLEGIDFNLIRKEYEKVREFIAKYVTDDIRELVSPEALYYTTLKLAENYGPLCSLMEDRALIQSILGMEEFRLSIHLFHAVDLNQNPEQVKEEVEEAVRKGAQGIKIISTLFMKELDDPSVEAAIEAAEELDVPVIVHAGCDPGIWELPSYCRYGNPAKLEEIIERHRNARIVVAHVGSYSALAPGVFMEETIQLVRRYPNVYTDVSTLSPLLLSIVARSLPIDKLLYGSDYPVVNVEPSEIISSYYEVLTGLGLSRRDLNKFFHANAEEVLGLRCG